MNFSVVGSNPRLLGFRTTALHGKRNFQRLREILRAMSQKNVEIVHAVLDAWNRGDFDAAVRHVHEDAELHFIGGFADLMGTEF
jgi:hypothetical protein